jgi:hypothetical protein
MIDIKSLVEGGIETAFSQLSQIVEEVTFSRFNGQYDTVTGDVSGGSEEVTVNCLFLESNVEDARFSYKAEMLDDAAEIADKKILARKKDFNSIQVSNEFKVLRVKEDTSWIIIDTILDPTETLYEFKVRRST